MLHPHSLPLDEEVQVCTETATGKRYVFASQLLYKHCVFTKKQKVIVEITDEMYGTVIQTLLTRKKMRNLAREWGDRIHENNEKRPLLFCQIRPDFHFLADGNHRLAYMWENDVKFAIAYICYEDTWKHFLVGDV